jgi:hypothetical protein
MTQQYQQRQGSIQNVLLAAFILAALALAGWFFIGPTSGISAQEGQQTAEAFLELIRQGNPSEAWDSTTAEFKSAEGRESFLRSLNTVKHVKEPVRFVSMQSVEANGLEKTEFLFQTESGKSIRIIMGMEDGRGKVEHWVP